MTKEWPGSNILHQLKLWLGEKWTSWKNLQEQNGVLMKKSWNLFTKEMYTHILNMDLARGWQRPRLTIRPQTKFRTRHYESSQVLWSQHQYKVWKILRTYHHYVREGNAKPWYRPPNISALKTIQWIQD